MNINRLLDNDRLPDNNRLLNKPRLLNRNRLLDKNQTTRQAQMAMKPVDLDALVTFIKVWGSESTGCLEIGYELSVFKWGGRGGREVNRRPPPWRGVFRELQAA